jgi:cytohesin
MNKIVKLIIITVLVLVTVLFSGCNRGIDTYVAEGDVEQVKRILRKEPEALRIRTRDSSSLLHVAALHGRNECVELLVSEGLEPDIRQIYGRRRPIHQAIMGGHLDTVKLLAGYGASVKKISRGETAPVYLASYTGRLEILQFLVAEGADVKETDKRGSNSLHVASSKGFPKIVKFLVERGVDVNVETRGKRRPLHLAARSGHLDICKYLLANGALLDPVSGNGWTPLLLAAARGQSDMVKYLAEQGANVRAASNDGYNLLQLAAIFQDQALIEFSVKNGISPDSVNNRGYSALHHCVARGYLDGIKSFLEVGAQPNIKDKYGYTPLQWARRSGRRKISELLTSMHMAAADGSLSNVKTLVERYPSLVNCRDENGWLPLHHAAKNGDRAVVDVLLRAGSERGQKALLESIPILRGSIARLLIPYDMRNYTRPYGKTPVEIAGQYGHSDLAAFLSSSVQPASI